MRRPMQTHGDQKIGTCEGCGCDFPKKRFDQTACSKPCRQKINTQKKPPWCDNPNRQRLNERRKTLYRLSSEETHKRIREDRAQNPEKYREWDRAKYQRNKPKHVERMKAYRAAHPDMRTKEYRKRKTKMPWVFLIASARKRSFKASLDFDLTREWAESVWTGRCSVSGIKFELGTVDHYPRSPSINRIDPSKGYTKPNCRFVLFAVNSLKGAGTDAEMLEIAKAIASQNP